MYKKVADDVAAGLDGEEPYGKPPRTAPATQQPARSRKSSDSKSKQENAGDRPYGMEERRALWV